MRGDTMPNLREHFAYACQLVLKGNVNGASWYWFNQLPEDKQKAIGSESQFCAEVKYLIEQYHEKRP